MKCHAIHCQNEPIPGMLMCYDHWMMLPAKVRARSPWAVRPAQVDRSADMHEKAVDKTGDLHRTGRGQLALFA